MNERTKRWRRKYPEKYKESKRLSDRKQYLKKSAAIIEKVRKWKADNRERVRANKRAYYARNKHKFRDAAARRAAHKLGNSVKCIRQDFWKKRLIQYKYKCAYCRQDLHGNGVRIHWDHVVPLARGGAHSERNLVPCCAGCNLQKGTHTREYFMSRKERSRALSR